MNKVSTTLAKCTHLIDTTLNINYLILRILLNEGLKGENEKSKPPSSVHRNRYHDPGVCCGIGDNRRQ